MGGCKVAPRKLGLRIKPTCFPGGSDIKNLPALQEIWVWFLGWEDPLGYSTFNVRSGGSEEIYLVQGEEQWLRFAGAALKRYPMSKVRRNPRKMVGVARRHQRADTLKQESQKSSQSNHTRATALSNSMRLSPALWGLPRWLGHGEEVWQYVVHWEGKGKPLQYSCLEIRMSSMKWQNDRILKEELPRLVGAQYATGDRWRNNSRKNEGIEPKQKQYSFVDLTGDRRKVQC